MKKGQLKIDLLGSSFKIQADESDEYLQKIYLHYVGLIEQVGQTSGVTDPMRLAILAGILATDELFKELYPVEQNVSSQVSLKESAQEDSCSVNAIDENIRADIEEQNSYGIDSYADIADSEIVLKNYSADELQDDSVRNDNLFIENDELSILAENMIEKLDNVLMQVKFENLSGLNTRNSLHRPNRNSYHTFYSTSNRKLETSYDNLD